MTSAFASLDWRGEKKAIMSKKKYCEDSVAVQRSESPLQKTYCSNKLKKINFILVLARPNIPYLSGCVFTFPHKSHKRLKNTREAEMDLISAVVLNQYPIRTVCVWSVVKAGVNGTMLHVKLI